MIFNYDFYIWLARWTFGWAACIFVISLFNFIAAHNKEEQKKIEGYSRKMETEHEKEGFFYE